MSPPCVHGTPSGRVSLHRHAGHFVLLVTALLMSSCRARPPYEGKSVGELEQMLRDADPAVQVQGAFGLGRLGPEARGAVASLAQALTAGDALVRQNAAAALAQVGPDARDAVPALTTGLRDPEWAVRRQAALTLGKIGAEARAALPALTKLGQGDPHGLVRTAARDAIKQIRP